MSKSSGFPQKLADLLRQNCLAVQMVGVVLAAGGFAGLWWLAPANRAAQLSAAVFGLALVLFAQFFFLLRRLKPEERRSLEGAGAGGLVLCLAASLGASGYHWTTGPRGGGGGAGGGRGSASGGAPQVNVTFAADEPNRLVIQVLVTKPDKVVVEVQNVWELTPPTQVPETLDWPPGVDVELRTDKQPPYKLNAFAGSELPIEVLLQPLFPDSSANPIQVENRWVTRLTFSKRPAKECVFLLRLSVVNKQGKTVPAGSVVYFPDLKTKYETLTQADREVLREIAAVQAPKSPKLTELLDRAAGAK